MREFSLKFQNHLAVFMFELDYDGNSKTDVRGLSRYFFYMFRGQLLYVYERKNIVCEMRACCKYT